MAFHSKTTIRLGQDILDLTSPKVMAIVNLTPDSFYDGGKHHDLDETIERCTVMVADGASILDIGGASSRPGAESIPVETEIERVVPLIKAVKRRIPDTIVSIDTFHSSVAERALGEGADMVNDISAGRLDPKMIPMVAEHDVPYITMHMQGTPQTMQDKPNYENVVTEVCAYLSERLAFCREQGINDVILDPGFGFGKDLDQNYLLLEQLGHLQLLGAPLLVGLSRKSMIQKALDVPADEALNGTSALNMIALDRGAKILRVHDVKEAVQCVRLHQKLKGS